MFRELLAHPQEALYKRQLLYYLRVMLLGWTRIGVVHSNPGPGCAAPPEVEQLMLETCRGPEFLIN
jgi:hypothetical protein